MKPLLRLLAFAPLLLFAAPASASGINLSWDDCGAFGTGNRDFACDTNAGEDVLVGSFSFPFAVSMIASEIVIDLYAPCPAFQEWWAMRTGLCRSGSLLYSFDFTGGPGSCYDYWQGAALGGISMDAPVGNRSRIKVLAALPAGSPINPIPVETEIYTFKARINHAKTVAPGACDGCQTGMCILLNSIKLVQPSPEPSYFLTNPDIRQVVTWQSAYFLPGEFHLPAQCVGDCPVPARNRTWGEIKSLYR